MLETHEHDVNEIRFTFVVFYAQSFLELLPTFRNRNGETNPQGPYSNFLSRAAAPRSNQ